MYRRPLQEYAGVVLFGTLIFFFVGYKNRPIGFIYKFIYKILSDELLHSLYPIKVIRIKYLCVKCGSV